MRLRLTADGEDAARARSAPSSTTIFAARHARGRRVLRRHASAAAVDRRASARRAAGLRRAAVVEAVLSLRRAGLARGRSRRSRRRRPSAQRGRNRDWPHLYNRDVISMPDKWEYPWYAAWDLAFHMIPFARIDPDFAKEQLAAASCASGTCTRTGRCPRTSSRFGDVNPPVHAWAVLARLQDDRRRAASATACFLARVFQKLLLNFTWWVNRKDVDGQATSSPAASSASTTSASSTARSRCRRAATWSRPTARRGWRSTARRCCRWRWSWRSDDPAYEDMASKFFEHFVAIADAMNTLGGTGLWDEEDGFYYDQLHVDGTARAAARALDGRAAAAVRRRGAGGRRHRPAARLQEADATGSSTTAATWPRHIASGREAHATAAPAARDPVARAARARAALHARRERVPVAVRHPLAVAGARARSPYRASHRRRGVPRRLRRRASRTRACSAATRTGAGRSGCRSTTCSSRRSSATTTSTATSCGSSARPARAGC